MTEQDPTKNPQVVEVVQETLSPQEERFERWRNTIGLFLGPLLALVVYLLPLPSLSPTAHLLAAVITLVGVWWITEPIPIPMSALLGAVLCVILGIADVKKVFAPFADPIIQLFLGSFMLAEAMAVQRLDKRFAYAIMSLKLVGNSTGRILLAFGVISGFLSMWISNTAATAMMFPIALGIVSAMADIMARRTGRTVDPRHLRFGTGMMLMSAYAASAGGIGTPVGTPPNLIGIALIEKFCQVRIPFFQWMSFAVPIVILQ
ncbi:MAG: SLC13 family permease, partial [Desulfobacterota bacterium]|nr:SLC13 family permease [Thermodesulfobacteriota bacterium]